MFLEVYGVWRSASRRLQCVSKVSDRLEKRMEDGKEKVANRTSGSLAASESRRRREQQRLGPGEEEGEGE